MMDGSAYLMHIFRLVLHGSFDGPIVPPEKLASSFSLATQAAVISVRDSSSSEG
jgi:hypothetical protein